MDTCSYFIKDKALFGSYPSEIAVRELEENGVRYFVNLTYEDEDKIKKYDTNYQIINYKIKDRSVPTDLLSFTKFIIKLSDIIKNLKIVQTFKIYETQINACRNKYLIAVLLTQDACKKLHWL